MTVVEGSQGRPSKNPPLEIKKNCVQWNNISEIINHPSTGSISNKFHRPPKNKIYIIVGGNLYLWPPLTIFCAQISHILCIWKFRITFFWCNFRFLEILESFFFYEKLSSKLVLTKIRIFNQDFEFAKFQSAGHIPGKNSKLVKIQLFVKNSIFCQKLCFLSKNRAFF